MSTLIIGGLFALALLAMIGVFFLARSEPRTLKVPTTQVHNEPLERNEPAQIANGGTLLQPGLPAPKEEIVLSKQTVPLQQNASRFPVTNGQFHKLSDELQALHIQAQEIEQRLSILAEMIEHIEREQSQFVRIDEEVARRTEPIGAN